MKGGEKVRNFEIEQISNLLDTAVLKQEQKEEKGPVLVSLIDADHQLVFDILPYQRRAVGVNGRLLTPDITRQPVLAIKNEKGIKPIPYAEDVIYHPLRDKIQKALETA